MIVRVIKEQNYCRIKKSERYLAVIVCITTTDDTISYVGINKQGPLHIGWYSPYETELIDDSIPKTWDVKKQGAYSNLSFKEWINEPAFAEYLIEDWSPDKHKWAQKLTDEWYQKIVDEYAIRLCGSTENARKEAKIITNHLTQKCHKGGKKSKTHPEEIQPSRPITLNELQTILEERKIVLPPQPQNAKIIEMTHGKKTKWPPSEQRIKKIAIIIYTKIYCMSKKDKVLMAPSPNARKIIKTITIILKLGIFLIAIVIIAIILIFLRGK